MPTARHALRRQLELVEALLLLDRLDFEIAKQQLVAKDVFARRFDRLLDLGAIHSDGDVLVSRHFFLQLALEHVDRA